MEKIKNYTLRVPEILLQKYHYVTKHNGRSVNAQLLLYIRKSVEEFERKMGEIPVEEPTEK